jgi:site-specific DNA-cytosine methylase
VKETVEIRHFHLFCGLGGGAKGFNQGKAEVGNLVARYRCIGGIDNDASAIRDFSALAGTPGTVLDMFDREQYRAFHGAEPPAEWREATPQDIHRAAGGERPHIVFLSAPCKGFSGLLSESRSKTEKYQALNRLTLRGVFLMLEAFKNDPPELVLFENVPRIANRGRHLLDQIGGMLRAYGYAVAETTHDCGEIGGLGQSRKRFLLVARHLAKVPPFLYEPDKKPLRSVGSVLERLPVPGAALGGPMHRVPSLQWKTWVRLAFVQAGSDWRSLNRLNVDDGWLRDYLIVPEGYHHGYLGVQAWEKPAGTVASRCGPTNGAFSIADPRFAGQEYSQYGVKRWSETASTVTSQRSPGQGNFSVADPRAEGVRHNNVFRVIPWSVPSQAVTGGTGPTSGGLAVADPRRGHCFSGYGVGKWESPARTVAGESLPSNGQFAVADPRMGWGEKREAYEGGGHYGVVPWASPSGAVSAAAGHDNGRWSVADPRTLPAPSAQLVARIIAEDGTWHRPFTTLELAALQGLVDPDADFLLDGQSDSAWRERIGNAVPAPAASAIASEMGRTLLLAWSGESFALSSTPIWVRPVAVALSVAQPVAGGALQ